MMNGTVTIMWPAMIRFERRAEADQREVHQRRQAEGEAGQDQRRHEEPVGDARQPVAVPREPERRHAAEQDAEAGRPGGDLRESCRRHDGSAATSRRRTGPRTIAGEKPVGGNFSDRPSVNDVVSTMTTGATMISSAREARPPITSV
jgi:hypothetical protein